MRLTATAQLLVKQFDGYLNLNAQVVAKEYFGVALKTALSIASFRTLIQPDKSASLIKLANLIDSNLDTKPGIEMLLAQKMLRFRLATEHGTSVIPLSAIADKYLNMSHKSAEAKFKTGELKKMGLKGFQLNASREAPILVLVSDLAKFMLAPRKLTIYDK